MKHGNKKIRIAVAMSGGVDSSVSAYLLHKQGYYVEGFFMKFWSDMKCGLESENSCCNADAIMAARATAEKIGIPFHVVSAKKIFKKIIVDDFISEYKKLRTPNPCVICNKLIKFGWFLGYARTLGFDKISTGHYARIRKDKNEIFHLEKAKDSVKDQSYFLSRLSQRELACSILPLAAYSKEEVRKIAREAGLPTAEKKESQEICFVPNDDYRSFLRRHLAKKYFRKGNIVDSRGNIIGEHDGFPNYTIGQRRGIAQDNIRSQNRKPLYVVGFLENKNSLLAGEDSDLWKYDFTLSEVSWTSRQAREKIKNRKNIIVKIRYRTPGIRIDKIKKIDKNRLYIVLCSPVRAIAPGQSAVFYHKNEVLGNGIIVSENGSIKKR